MTALDFLGRALRDLAVVTGSTEYDEKASKPFPTLSSQVVSLLHHEAAILRSRQEAMDLSKGACTSNEQLTELAQQSSLFCNECWTEIERACAAKFPNVATLLQTHRSRRKASWSQDSFYTQPLRFSDGDE